MLRRITNWGGPTFLLAVICLALGTLLSFRINLLNSENFYSVILPKTGIGLSIALILACQISYHRIVNARIYLLGMIAGLNGLVENLLMGRFIKLELHPDIDHYFLFFLQLILIVTCLLPGSIKFSLLKKVTASAALLYIVGIFVWNGSADMVMDLLYEPGGTPSPLHGLIGFTVPGAAALLTVFFLGNQFYLGGVFAGSGLLIAGLWFRNQYLADAASYYFLGSQLLLVYLMLSIIIHWIAKVSHNIAIDPLMQIYNRSYCNNIIREQSSVNTAPPLSVIMVDIDHFKKVNDVHGHQAGDTVLKKVAQTLKVSLGSKAVICRYGGEEILIFISRTSGKQAEAIVEKARLAIKKLRVKVGRKSLKVTISAGISQRMKKSQSVESVISAADKAVYKAKKAGRDRIHTVKVYSKKK